jgi:hypothetical protein
MPSKEKTSLIKFQGGLDTVSDRLALFQVPGKTINMVNFESGILGGYRRINGFTKYSALSPDGIGTNPVVSARSYFNGSVAVQGGDIYFSADGTSWLQVNKDTSDAFVDAATLAGLGALPRTTNGTERYRYAEWHNGTEAELYFVDTLGINPIGKLVIRENGGTEYKYKHAGATDWGTGFEREPTTIEVHSERLVVAGDPDFKNEIAYSNILAPLDFIGGGRINVADEVVWCETFRENLVVFNKGSLKTITGLGDPTRQLITPITNKIGCIAGGSVQEYAGGLIFLAPDGLRTVSATQRIDDFELGTVTTTIHNEVLNIISQLNIGTIISTVVRSRNLYKIYLDVPGIGTIGIGGVIRKALPGQSLEAGVAIEWNTYTDNPLCDVNSTRNDSDQEVLFQTNGDGFVYLHDTGSTFDGTHIPATFQTPDLSFDDPNIRKTLNIVEIYTEEEGATAYNMKALFDEQLQASASPSVFSIDTSAEIPLYGTAVYGTATYADIDTKITRIYVEGSGKLISFIFQSHNGSAPFTIQGININYFLNGRY